MSNDKTQTWAEAADAWRAATAEVSTAAADLGASLSYYWKLVVGVLIAMKALRLGIALAVLLSR
ncbi:hypothetical protein [Polyangium mundeleinium]|uniref:Phage holin family protein n=1 Tax=Polyangium mundeleinium TaxID=2995306 RepID=A0ABT5EGM1_9BACT|nr:hypothetical protein [Polyangium mundeleinium]MDC0740916.1 hypothetical protein [Polyangium mundeleinium]